MERVSRLYVDANILIALAEGSDDDSNLLLALIKHPDPQQPRFLCTSELSLSELLPRPFREKRDDLIAIYDSWTQQQNPWLEVAPISRQILWNAAILRAVHGSLKLPDAIHLTTALSLRCSHFLTADLRIPKMVTLTHRYRHNDDGPGSMRILRPEPLVLEAVIKDRMAP